MSQRKMICADCGAEMNHHAMKVDYSDDSVQSDSAFGGVLKEVHTCPQCGRIDLRTARFFLKLNNKWQRQGTNEENLPPKNSG
jgi:hypothetical protein